MSACKARQRLTERLVGITVARLDDDPLEQEVMRGSQALRTFQSQKSLVLVSVVGLAYYLSFRDRTDATALALWLGAIVATTFIRSWICLRVERSLEQDSANSLMRNESVLFLSGVTMPLIIGTGYWIVCLPGDERTVLAVTLMSAMYSIGSTINSMTQIRLLPILLLANLGQGVAFFAGLGDSDEPAIALLLAAIILLELGFAKRNSAFFRESVGIRLENIDRNRVLKENQLLVESALESAREASQSKSHFLAAASHDLRQPLHALMLFIGALKQSSTSDAQRELIGNTAEAAEQLRGQFDALLDLSSLDAGGLKSSPRMIDLAEFLPRSLAAVRPQASAKGLALRCDAAPVELTVDPMLLGRLLDNLLGNAVRYTERGSIELRARSNASTRQAIIEVIDTGIGIADDRRQLIFDDFTQLNNPTRHRSKGSGLGLAIVRRLADVLNARIDVDSTLGEGSCFRLTLPLDAAGMPARIECTRPNRVSPGVVTPPISLRGLTLLVVDDEPRVLDALNHYVASRDGASVAVDTHREAVATLRERRIDFAIVDDMLDDERSGLELALLIAREQGRQNVIVVTGNESPARLQSIRDSGIDAYRKPLTAEQLDLIIGERLSLIGSGST